MELAGSEDRLRPGEHRIGDVAPGHVFTLTIYFQRAAADSLEAQPHAFESALAFAQQNRMRVVQQNPAARQLKLEATAAQIESAFGVHLFRAEDAQGHKFVTYEGGIQLPENLAGSVVAVLGLSQRAVARSH